MNFDLTFPHYAKRMNQYILVIAVIGAGILLAWQGWAYAIAWGLGCLFHIFFFSLMLVKYIGLFRWLTYTACCNSWGAAGRFN